MALATLNISWHVMKRDTDGRYVHHWALYPMRLFGVQTAPSNWPPASSRHPKHIGLKGFTTINHTIVPAPKIIWLQLNKTKEWPMHFAKAQAFLSKQLVDPLT